jgi:hypothetical protein
MSTVDEIKAAAAKLSPEEQYDLFRWWIESDTFKARQIAALKKDLAAGIEDLEQGRYREYDDSNVMHLAEEVGRSGRERLKKSRKNRKA